MSGRLLSHHFREILLVSLRHGPASDFEFTETDAIRAAADRRTGLVNDQPGEAILQPAGRSEVVFEQATERDLSASGSPHRQNP